MNLFALLLGLGATAGLANVWLQAGSLRAPRLIEAGLVILLGGFLSGRLGFVLLDWAYYQSHLLEIPLVGSGGFSGLAAAAGCLLAIIPASRVAHLPILKTIDRLSPMLAPLAISAWLAAWVSGVAYGASVSPTWWAFPARDEWSMVSYRFPLQLLGAVISLVLFLTIDLTRQHLKRSGQVGSLRLLAMFLPLAGLSFLRVDPTIQWHGFRLDALASLVLLAVCIYPNVLAFWPLRWKRNHQALPESPASQGVHSTGRS